MVSFSYWLYQVMCVYQTQFLIEELEFLLFNQSNIFLLLKVYIPYCFVVSSDEKILMRFEKRE